jgi:hypothetical protein
VLTVRVFPDPEVVAPPDPNRFRIPPEGVALPVLPSKVVLLTPPVNVRAPGLPEKENPVEPPLRLIFPETGEMAPPEFPVRVERELPPDVILVQVAVVTPPTVCLDARTYTWPSTAAN